MIHDYVDSTVLVVITDTSSLAESTFAKYFYSQGALQYVPKPSTKYTGFLLQSTLLPNAKGIPQIPTYVLYDDRSKPVFARMDWILSTLTRILGEHMRRYYDIGSREFTSRCVAIKDPRFELYGKGIGVLEYPITSIAKWFDMPLNLHELF